MAFVYKIWFSFDEITGAIRRKMLLEPLYDKYLTESRFFYNIAYIPKYNSLGFIKSNFASGYSYSEGG